MPEPPTVFDLDSVNKQEAVATNQPLNPDVHVIIGAAGAVPAGAVVRVTNLDTTLDVAATNASPQGSFEVAVEVLDGEELRFEWADGQRRSAPADAIFVLPDPAVEVFQLTRSARFECLSLTPGFVLDFATDSETSLTLTNDCAGPLALDNARSRLALGDFSLPAALPLELAAGDSVPLVVQFARGGAGLREDVLFIDVTLDAETIRYPVTLRAE